MRLNRKCPLYSRFYLLERLCLVAFVKHEGNFVCRRAFQYIENCTAALQEFSDILIAAKEQDNYESTSCDHHLDAVLIVGHESKPNFKVARLNGGALTCEPSMFFGNSRYPKAEAIRF